LKKVLDWDRNSIEVLTSEKADMYFKKVEAAKEGEIGDREWRLRKARKA
jgi:hypothetical protein